MHWGCLNETPLEALGSLSAPLGRAVAREEHIDARTVHGKELSSL